MKCVKCSTSLAPGEIPVVFKWTSIMWGKTAVQTPAIVKCRVCAPPPVPKVAKTVEIKAPLAPTELPYKPGSFKRKLIEAALHGLNVSTLATMAAEAGKRMDPYKNKLMGGKGKTHRWAVRVEGGAIFISDIRPVTA